MASFCAVPIAMAQSRAHPVRLYTKETGFNFGFRKIVGDNNNFIWLLNDWSFNERTVQRFDGEHLDTYFEGVDVHSLISDAQGTIWVSGDEGVFFFDTSVNGFVEVGIQEGADLDKLLLAPPTGTPYYVSKNGLYRYREEQRSFVCQKNIFQDTGQVPTIGQERISLYGDMVFYGVSDTVWRHSLRKGKKAHRHFPQIRNVIALSGEEVIVSTWETKSWLYNFSSGEKKRLVLPDGNQSFFVMDAAPAGNDLYYLASLDGLFLLDGRAGTIRPVPLELQGEAFPQQRYQALYRAPDGNIWAGTESSLLYFNDTPYQIHFLNGRTGTFSGDVRSFLEDERGNLWLATINGLTYWDLDDNTFVTMPAVEGAKDRLNHPSIRGLARDGPDIIIGQTNKGLWYYNPGTKVFHRPVFEDSEIGEKLRQKTERAFFNQIITLKNGNHVAVAENGAYHIEKGSRKVKEIDFPGAGDNVRFAYEDSFGNIFIGTFNGLYCLDASHNLKFHIVEGFENTKLLSMLEHGGGYYLGTVKGVYFFSVKNNLPLLEKTIPELSDHGINSLFGDRDGQLWLVSYSELHSYDHKGKMLTTFGHADNVHGGFFNRNSYLTTRSGQVFIGGTNGINHFFPEKVDYTAPVLRPIIQNVRIPEQGTVIKTVDSSFSLKYPYRNVEIDFTTAYYGMPENLEYRYRLTKDGPWFHLGNQKRLFLWNLPPDKYRFQVAASSMKDEWHTSKDVVTFTIVPPFWQRWWFIAALILLAGILFYKFITSNQEKLRIEKMLNVFATSLYGQHTVDDILWDTARNCVQNLGFVDAIVYLVDRERKVLVQKAAFGIKNPYGKKIINIMEIPIGEGIVGSVAKTGRPERIADTEKDPRYIPDSEKALSEITVPIWIDGKVFAILDSEHPEKNFYKFYHLDLLEKIADICSERISKYLIEEELRGKMARDLHDEMGSTLTSIQIISKMASQDTKDSPSFQKQFDQIHRRTSGIMEKMGDLVWVVNPANDSLDQVIYRIKEYAADVTEPTGMRLDIAEANNAENIKMDPEQRKNIYLIAKETLNNAVRHSGASNITITFEENGNIIGMCIKDNGKGYDPNTARTGNGLRNISTRAQEIKGNLKIETGNGNGVSVCLTLPITKVFPDRSPKTDDHGR
ncbi:two-component regulator propeller domain-containing protein [Muricauda sp. MAR_2010_75]|uniref:two-component regulator propeller domain-containing protein n=1 Tax=Allomuricauda sp. MAR_2010_75 TaxID=1250232 RepID=UPI00068B61E3|nr:two-component regulator propeller domain-containing protein [Muricauda sp. MAR_2010_75]